MSGPDPQRVEIALRVLAAVEYFIRDEEITGGEAVYQSDNVLENAPDFIIEICEIVGYHRDSDG